AAANDTRTYLWHQLAEAGARVGRPAGLSPFAPTNDRLATVLPDGRVAISDLATDRTQFFEGHVGTVLALAWSSDGKTLVTGGRDATLRWRDAITGTTLRLVTRNAAVTAVVISDDQRWLVSGGANGTVRIDPTSIVDARLRACASLAHFGEPCR